MSTELLDIDFNTPQFLIHHYYASGAVSILMNTFVFYLLLFQKGKMDSFRYYLLGFQVACALCDIHLSFLMQPIPLFPVVAGHCSGVLAIHFGVSPHFLMTVLSFLVGFQVNALNICFLRKHQAIAKISSKYILSKKIYNFLVFFFLSYIFSYTFPFYLSKYTKEEEYGIIDKKYPQFRSGFEGLPNFDLFELNGMMFTFFIMIIIGCIQSTVTVSILVFQMYRVLVHCSLNLSKSTLEKHKSAVKSLVGQFLTTPIAILPAMLIVSTVFVPFPGAQVFTWYMLMTMATHSTINCLVVIFTFPEFRAFVLFWSKEGKLRRHRKSVFCAVGDIHLSVLMQPIGLFPITAGYSNGLLGQFLSVPVDIQMTLLSLLASLQVNGLNICFLRKYKTIADMSSRFQLNVIVYRITVSILGTYPILFSGAFFLSGIPKEEQLVVIRKEYPYFEQEFLSLKDFQLYVMNFWMSMYFFLAMFGCIQSGATIGISVLQMVRTLHEVKSLISKVTWKKHRVAVRNLILQFQSSLVGIVPAVSIAFVVVIPTKYSQVLSYYFTMIVAIHSTCNAIVMMITYPELRKHAMFWKKPEISTISVSVTQNSSQRVRSIVQT